MFSIAGGEAEIEECWGWGGDETPWTERYLKKLRPVPGKVKETQSDPVGDLPIRKPPNPQLTPAPREVNVVLTPPPRFIKSRQRHAKGMLRI